MSLSRAESLEDALNAGRSRLGLALAASHILR
jgi:hypothetical protein